MDQSQTVTAVNNNQDFMWSLLYDDSIFGANQIEPEVALNYHDLHQMTDQDGSKKLTTTASNANKPLSADPLLKLEVPSPGSPFSMDFEDRDEESTPTSSLLSLLDDDSDETILDESEDFTGFMDAEDAVPQSSKIEEDVKPYVSPVQAVPSSTPAPPAPVDRPRRSAALRNHAIYSDNIETKPTPATAERNVVKAQRQRSTRVNENAKSFSFIAKKVTGAKRIPKLFPREVLRCENKEWRSYWSQVRKLNQLTKAEEKSVLEQRKKHRNCIYAERARQKRIADYRAAKQTVGVLQQQNQRTEAEYQELVSRNEKLRQDKCKLLDLLNKAASHDPEIKQALDRFYM